MTPARKLKMFDLLVRMGYKEIEVGFPAASQTDFDFVRQLVEGDRIPDDVTISVLTQAREDLIERTVQSLVGARPRDRPPLQRDRAAVPPRRLRRRQGRVPGDRGPRHRDGHEVRRGAASATATSATSTRRRSSPAPSWRSPSTSARRSPTSGSPTTAARSSSTCRRRSRWRRPNVYADQIEWFSRHLTRREHSAISLHPHNDRGTAVAATELAHDGRRRPRRGLPVRPRRAHRQRLTW